MALHDTDSQEIETTGVAESLPDPTTVNGRTHELTNTGTATVTWSSVGATPFQEGGVNVASITIARGASKQFQSDGSRWVAKLKGDRSFFAATGVTDGAGNVTFTYPVGLFSATPVVNGQVGPSADTALVEARLTASSAASCTFNVRRSPSVVILGISVLQVPANAPGVTVQCMATPAGATP